MQSVSNPTYVLPLGTLQQHDTRIAKWVSFTVLVLLITNPNVRLDSRLSRTVPADPYKIRSFLSLVCNLRHRYYFFSMRYVGHEVSTYLFLMFANICATHTFTFFHSNRKKSRWTVPTREQPQFILLAEIEKHIMYRLCNECEASQTRCSVSRNCLHKPSNRPGYIRLVFVWKHSIFWRSQQTLMYLNSQRTENFVSIDCYILSFSAVWGQITLFIGIILIYCFSTSTDLFWYSTTYPLCRSYSIPILLFINA